MNRAVFDTMAARVFVLLLAGIVAAALLAFAIAGLQARATAAADSEQRLVDRIADAAAVLSAAPPDARPDVLGVGPEALRRDAGTAAFGSEDAALGARIDARLGTLAVAAVSLPSDTPCPTPPALRPPGLKPPGPGPERGPTPPPPPPRTDAGPPAPPPPPGADGCRRVRLSFPDGERLQLIAPTGPPPATPPLPLGPAPLVAVALVASGLAWMVARLAVAPLRRLADAARGLGETLDRAPLTPSGPREVRLAAQAFNTMQARLKREMEERTYMLAAITHDLQTPLTRQRLRLEKIADADLRDRLLADQEAMRVLIREGLDLARAAHEGEEAALLEVDSLLDSVADDAIAAGQDVKVVGRCGCTVRTRPQALARGLANLVDNALKYAGAAELAAERTETGVVVVRILDRGPGVPEDELERLFEPFHRGEGSRSRETGGAGLGLTIAHRLMARSGGELTLHNRFGGGLEARLSFVGPSAQP